MVRPGGRWRRWLPVIPCLLQAVPARACSVIPYFTMMFEGNDEQTGLMTRGFLVAMIVVVLLKAGLLEAHLRRRGSLRAVSRPASLGGILVAVVIANLVSLLAGFFTVQSFATTGGMQVLFMPALVLVSGGLWLLVLRWAVKAEADSGWFLGKWLVLVTLFGVLIYPVSILLLVAGFYLAVLSPVLLLLLVLFRKIGLLAPASPPSPGTAAPGEQEFTGVLGAICGLGLVSAIVGGQLVTHLRHLPAAGPAEPMLSYWAMKIVAVTSLFGIGLVSTTAIEAIVLLPLYRLAFADRLRADNGSAPPLSPYLEFFGDLFRVNATAIILVLFILAVRTLPVRLGSPGFLF